MAVPRVLRLAAAAGGPLSSTAPYGATARAALVERLRAGPGLTTVHEVGPDALLAHVEGWCATPEAYLAALLAEIAWGDHHVRLFGRAILEPRRSAWMGEVGYRYSGRTLTPAPPPPAVATLRSALETQLGWPLPGVLANLYRDGRDAMGWHADDEPELGAEPLIASLSFGATRRFVVKARAAGAAPLALALTSGSLVVMAGALQRTHRHALPRALRVTTPRVNLTYRWFPSDPAAGPT